MRREKTAKTPPCTPAALLLPGLRPSEPAFATDDVGTEYIVKYKESAAWLTEYGVLCKASQQTL